MNHTNTNRRHFIRGSLLASGGLLLLSPVYSFASGKAKEGSKSDLSSFCDTSRLPFGRQVDISGRVFDASGRFPLAGIEMDYWHLSPGSENKHHKGKLITDANGFYRIKSDFPGRESGRHATLHFRVSDGKKDQCACLKLSSTGAFITDEHWFNHKGLPENLLFPRWDQKSTNTIEFNFSL